MSEPTVEITVARLSDLEEDARTLRALEAAGVDNWPGYDLAMEQLASES